MDRKNVTIRIEAIGTPEEREAAFRRVVEYILKRYCEVWENEECNNISEGFNRGTG